MDKQYLGDGIDVEISEHSFTLVLTDRDTGNALILYNPELTHLINYVLRHHKERTGKDWVVK